MDGRKNNGAGPGGNPGAGRPGKAEEQKLIENLTPLNPMALDALKEGLNNQESWAVKLFFAYFYGNPQQRIDMTSGGEPMNIPAISYFDTK